MTPVHVAISLLLLAGLGAFPAYRISGDWMAVFLAPLIGAVTLCFGAILLVLLPGHLWWWSGLVALIFHGVASVRGPAAYSSRSRRASLTSALVLSVALLVPLMALRRHEAFYDARSIWFFHARWLSAGHDFALAALANPAFAFSHSDYPPLVPAAVAGAWMATGSGFDYRLAQVLVTALNACAVALLAWGVTEAAGAERRTSGLVTAAILVIGCFGIAGTTGSDGYADLLWAAAAAAAAVWGLLLPVSPRHRAVALVLVVVAATTKNEGLVVGGFIAVLIGCRGWLEDRPAGRALKPRGVVVGSVVGACLLAWPITSRAAGATSDIATDSNLGRLLSADPLVTARIAPVLDGLVPRLPLLWIALAVALVAVPLLDHARRQQGLAHPLWLGAVALVAGLSLVAAYLLNPSEIDWLIATSMDRTTIFLNVLALAVLGVWGVMAVSELAGCLGYLTRPKPTVIAALDVSQSKLEATTPGPAPPKENGRDRAQERLTHLTILSERHSGPAVPTLSRPLRARRH